MFCECVGNLLYITTSNTFHPHRFPRGDSSEADSDYSWATRAQRATLVGRNEPEAESERDIPLIGCYSYYRTERLRFISKSREDTQVQGMGCWKYQKPSRRRPDIVQCTRSGLASARNHNLPKNEQSFAHGSMQVDCLVSHSQSTA
jgi:hypothetical protein